MHCYRCRSNDVWFYSGKPYCQSCGHLAVKPKKRVPQDVLEKRKKEYKAPHPFNEFGKNLFSEEDHRIVKRALLSIPEKEQRIVFLYFWKDWKKDEIAGRLKMSRESVDQTLRSAIVRLKELCLQHPKFSRSIRGLKVETENHETEHAEELSNV